MSTHTHISMARPSQGAEPCRSPARAPHSHTLAAGRPALHLEPRACPPPSMPPPHTTTTIADLPDGVLHAVLDTLGPRDLVAAAATCRRWAALASDEASDRAWRAFFTSRWRPGDAVLASRPTVPPGSVSGQGACRPSPPWRAAYGRRLAEASALAPPTRPTPDSLAGGHRGGARAVSLLPSLGLAVSAGSDRVVRVFDLAAGLPLTTSRRLPWAVRCVAAEPAFLAAASGADDRIALWRPAPDDAGDTSVEAVPWDLARRPAVLAGHTGPVAGLATSEEGEGGGGGAAPPRLYSASWDCSVRVWDAVSATCVAAAPLTDWVWSAAPRGGRLVCAEGRGAAVLDGHTLAVLARVLPFLTATPPSAPPGPCARVEGSRDGRALFVAHADGGIASYDLRARGPTARSLLRSAVLVAPGTPGYPPASSLAYDDPWLALGLAPSSVALLDTRSGGCAERAGGAAPHAHAPPAFTTRRLNTSAAGAGSVLGVDLAGPYLAAAFSTGVVLTWRWDAVAAATARARARVARSWVRARQTQGGGQAPPPSPLAAAAAPVAENWEDAAITA